jgi:acetoin utilization protein AcuB
MLVRERMTSHPLTTSVTDALNYMRHNRVRRLPVLNKRGDLVGIVAEKDLLYASPSPATSLSVYEIGYLLSKLKVQEVMQREVITVRPDCPLEEAARIMVDFKIGSLPVVEGGKLAGIITETDLFKVFIEMLGARDAGWRVSVAVPNRPGELARLTAEIANRGGDIVALGTYYGQDYTQGRLTLKVRGLDKEVLLDALNKAGAQVLDIR